MSEVSREVQAENIFYASPEYIYGSRIELHGQEAVHATKSLRYTKGDAITIVDGCGKWYEGMIRNISRNEVQVETSGKIIQNQPRPAPILGMGIIKKRDRLEFAVEKAVELGVREVALFCGEHTVKQKVRLKRLNKIAVSAMKQSLQAWLPQFQVFSSLQNMITHYPKCAIIAGCKTANQSIDALKPALADIKEHGPLLIVGPEGGLSTTELVYLQQQEANFVSLGRNRLRTETAAVTLLSQLHFSTT
jgi:16S rRNA (uracil1498-N3)-methyltransferase